MREIKFRAWDKIEKRILDWDGMYGIVRAKDNEVGVHVAIADQCYIMPEDCILMQFTGLRDKNGKEIYEGDFVKIKNEYGEDLLPETVTVSVMAGWRSVFEWTEMDEEGPNKKCRDMALTYENGREIIGNVYENPELTMAVTP